MQSSRTVCVLIIVCCGQVLSFKLLNLGCKVLSEKGAGGALGEVFPQWIFLVPVTYYDTT